MPARAGVVLGGKTPIRGLVAPIWDGIWYGRAADEAAAADAVAVAVEVGVGPGRGRRRAAGLAVAEEEAFIEEVAVEVGFGLGTLLELEPEGMGCVPFWSILKPKRPCSPELR